ncbi:ORF6N domain-containing protein [bacterium]|nr:ORF6N domain-containing protein [bacterium]MBU3955715.1 ORF6N domain-containing protein [bacterium]MBU4133950.1 ORF6N domain-containing protein [bacterium]
MSDLVPVEIIANKIFLIRGQKVMLDRDLAELYGVSTGRLNEQVKRNEKRFPVEFMCQLSKEEFNNLKSQFAISRWGGIRKLLIKTFIRMREMMLSYKDLKEKIEKMESKYDKQFRIVFHALKQLLEPPKPNPTRKMGF